MSIELTNEEREALADEVLGGATPSPLMVRAVERIVAARVASALAPVEALADAWDREANAYIPKDKWRLISRARALRAALSSHQGPAMTHTAENDAPLSPRVCTDPACTIPRRPGFPMHGPHDFIAGKRVLPPEVDQP